MTNKHLDNLEHELIKVLNSEEQQDSIKTNQYAQDKIDDLRNKDNQIADSLSNARIAKAIHDHSLKIPGNVRDYVDATYHYGRYFTTDIVKPTLTKPIEITKTYTKLMSIITKIETTNENPDILISPAKYPIGLYNIMYPHRKIKIDEGIYKYQMERTLEVIDNVWMYVLEHEIKRCNPYTPFTIKVLKYPMYDYYTGYLYYSEYDKHIGVDFIIETNRLIIRTMKEKLAIINRLRLLLIILKPKLDSFPQREQYHLAANIKDIIVEIQAKLNKGSRVKSLRKNAYQEALGDLGKLEVYIDTAFDLHYMSFAFTHDIQKEITNITNMTAALLKATINGVKHPMLTINSNAKNLKHDDILKDKTKNAAEANITNEEEREVLDKETLNNLMKDNTEFSEEYLKTYYDRYGIYYDIKENKWNIDRSHPRYHR